MKIITLFAAVLLLLLPSIVLATPAETKYFQIERNKQTEMDLRISSIGSFGINKDKIGHVNLSYIESISEGDALVLDLGGGVSFQAGLTFFIGGGILLGYNWDNSNYITAYYPEAGAYMQLSQSLMLVATKKRFYNLYDGIEGEDVVIFGLLFLTD